jgi:superfamily II DNA or RNA helicase
VKPGLYEKLITLGLAERLKALGLESVREGAGEIAPQALSRHLFDAVIKALRNVPLEERAARQRELANKIVAMLGTEVPSAGIDRADEVADPIELLLALRDPTEARLGTGEIERPKLPLGQSDLLINGPRDLAIGHEIRSELASATAVDVIVSFVKWTGVRVIRPELEDFARRHPGRLRLLTTTYMGATEIEALDALVELGAEVKVSYDARRTRLHAKAWLFHRDTGYSTGIIGSSNLSQAALLDGCEWNVRLSMVDNRTILEKFITTFDQYWSDVAFEPYDRAKFAEAAEYRDPARDLLARAVQIRPFPHQSIALDQLANERAHGHMRNLVVAATGTGKTVVAALDYARLRKELGGDPSLLFIAHREEILQQSLAKYRAALGDGYFGELLVGAHKPRRGRHVFASIQALHEDRRASLQPDAYDVIVVDEFHHAAAQSYTDVLNYFNPKILLGLTATPERADGKSVLPWFDGRIAAELRLWDALDQGLVIPFQYFGVHDGTHLSTIAFNRGRYDVASLESLYTADHVRANAVLRAIHTTIRVPHQIRALGFCVSVKHAEFMAAFFNAKGLPSLSVDHESSDAKRAAALQELRSGKVNVLFVRDLFNEGLDIPGIDTVLFLRPTESATIFLQQLGRGLRHEEGKSCLTVLDFIGDAHRSFRFIDRFRALTRGTRAEVHRAIADGFPRLPAGCDIRLDRESQHAVLANVRQSLSHNWNQLADDLRHTGDVPLSSFLTAADLEPEELYSNDSRTFTELRHRAGFRKDSLPNTELTRAISRLTYVDDEVRLQQWAAWLAQDRPPAPDLSNPLMLMMFSALGFVKRPVTEMSQAFDELWSVPDLRREIVELLRLLDDRSRRPTFAFPDLPFRLHASYSRDEISAGLLQTRRKSEKGTDRRGPAKLLRTQGGVFQCKDARSDILYVELDKDPKHYTPTTLYDDRAVTPSLFHWESQSVTRAESETGRRYRASASSDWRILLFVRHKPDDARGFTSPYLFLGRVRYVSHESEKPMRIMWKLDAEMPLDFFSEVKIAAG